MGRYLKFISARAAIGCLCAFTGLSTLTASAADYIGAEAVLQKVEAGSTNSPAKPAHDERATFQDALKEFKRASATLPSAEAVKQWLALVDREAKLPPASDREMMRWNRNGAASGVLSVLPPPASWPDLSKAILARPPAKAENEIREAGLRFLAATLLGDTEARAREITNLSAKAATNNENEMYYREYISEYSRAMVQFSDDSGLVMKLLERQLARANQGGNEYINVPNLVAQAGPEKAEAFLRKALVARNVQLQFYQAGKTVYLARKLALELVDQLKAPQWSLVNSLDASALYEAMDKHFGHETNADPAIPGLPAELSGGGNDFEKGGAKIYYMLGLISKDRAKDAVAVARQFNGQLSGVWSGDAFKAMEKAGYTAALDNFLHELLSQNPTLPFWEEYVDLAAKAGQTQRMLELVHATLARDDLSEKKKANLHGILFRAHLAADDVNGGVDEMRKLIAIGSGESSDRGYNAGQLGIMLARIGILLQKTDWTDEGIEVAKKWFATNSVRQTEDERGGYSVADSLSKILLELKRGPEAETILADALSRTTKAKPEPRRFRPFDRSVPRASLVQLATLYHEAGRYDDVLKLLEASPDWGVKDISDLNDGGSAMMNPMSVMWLHTAEARMPISYIAADSLLKSGRKEEASKITDALLESEPGLDRGYELLLAIHGSNAISRLDELFARDQFEERPLIWKAHILISQNQLEPAEKILRQAIAIDPSDGEEGPGDRMRVYAELAQVLLLRGNLNDSKLYTEVVAAIRLSEQADKFYQAGLLKRAVAMYKDGLNHFADAYCIQSRLAIQLSALGKNEEAEEHYRRAFELMPDSFGRVESHCFGCERAFDGERAQSIAEKVFTKIAAEHPDKPQVHYLLGYLREEEDRPNEARTNYLEAVRLDPDYLNAWVKLNSVNEQANASLKERDQPVFNILRLDPTHRHANVSFERISDLSGLWDAVATAESHHVASVTNLFTLVASKAALEKEKPKSEGASPSDEMMEMMQYSEMVYDRKSVSPAGAISQTPFVRLAGQIIQARNQSVEY